MTKRASIDRRARPEKLRVETSTYSGRVSLRLDFVEPLAQLGDQPRQDVEPAVELFGLAAPEMALGRARFSSRGTT